jgi:general secretion pathway protein I
MSVDQTRRDNGFTLIEVVVALAIASLALVGLFEAGSGGLFATDNAAQAEEAAERAQSHLAAIGRDAALVAGDSAGDDGGGYRWHLRVVPAATRPLAGLVGAPPNLLTLYDVEVAESWRSGGHVRQVVLTTMRLGSAPASE